MFRYLIPLFLLLLESLKPVAGNSEEELDCASCHKIQHNEWLSSDHAHAMAKATSENVLGNFSNITLNHYDQSAIFSKKHDQYTVTLSRGKNTAEHKVLYTFGHFPLQQYLVAGKRGRMQVLPFAWDSRPSSAGGQRWYPVYADENIPPDDRLHWQQPLQNWNGMCADCHSDGLTRNYNSQTDNFETEWANDNVGCQSCHGLMPQEHVKKKVAQSQIGEDLKAWVRQLNQDTATWQGPARNNDFMQTCYACHSLRSPLTDGFDADTPFLDQFSPHFLDNPLYHPDGQIQEEVYVYGSFLQSKMHSAGVNCLDCHNSHSMKLKIEGNGLCLQCHSPAKFDQTSHHGHQLTTSGSQCVDCHMPNTTYMGVDERRDHSFKVPRPNLAEQFNLPIACANCHEKQNAQWTISAIGEWHGKAPDINPNYLVFLRLQSGQTVTFSDHVKLIEDEGIDVISRATAITLLPNTTSQIPEQIVSKWVASPEPLIRLAIARTGGHLASFVRQLSYAKLLDDKYRAIRLAAANFLVSTPSMKKDNFNAAFSELLEANRVNSWRGEGNLNTSMLFTKRGQTKEAIKALEHSIQVDPYFAESYVNLADIYRTSGDLSLEKTTFEAALDAVPESAIVHYAYGLFLVRQEQRKAAVNSFSTASSLEPGNIQYAYVHGLALDSIGDTQLAIESLKMALLKTRNNQQLSQLGANLARKLNDRESLEYFSQRRKSP